MTYDLTENNDDLAFHLVHNLLNEIKVDFNSKGYSKAYHNLPFEKRYHMIQRAIETHVKNAIDIDCNASLRLNATSDFMNKLTMELME